jgi:hypothetical protein
MRMRSCRHPDDAMRSQAEQDGFRLWRREALKVQEAKPIPSTSSLNR